MISLESRVYPLPSPVYDQHPPQELRSVYATVGKRVFDLTVTVLLTVFVFAWLVPIIALAIVLTSPGPVVFAQLRTGRKGRPFRCLKFRTTVVASRPGFRSEPQLTTVGQWLQATHLDKLPHFFNVLIGDMSLVGPRPHTLQEDAQHWTQPGYQDRHRVRPGITGLAQTRTRLADRPGRMQRQHGIRYDRWYAAHASLVLDFTIGWWALAGSRRARR
ncbi:sugar transferase [Larkinella bovis]|uniref:Sugar transferase n=1 Tax=Larkinella bovis TaxID=683041 RepID=A0ABW0I9D6_9BACT